MLLYIFITTLSVSSWSATILTFQAKLLMSSSSSPMAVAISALLATWFTPSSLFIFVNIVIGTIAVTSRFASAQKTKHNHHDDSPQLIRSPSLLQRLSSFRLSYCNNHNYYHPAVAFAETVAAEGTHPHLLRTPSLLERLRSFKSGHYDCSSDDSTAFVEPHSTQPQLVRTPSLLERVRSFNFGLHNKHETSQAETECNEAHEPESEGTKEPQLARAPSLLQRLQSINLSRIYRSDMVRADEESEPENEDPDSKSGENGAEKMRKSASERGHEARCEWEEDEDTVEKRRPETSRAETSTFREDKEIDAKADDFINRFKKQLRLQRVDSLLRYREMLRGN